MSAPAMRQQAASGLEIASATAQIELNEPQFAHRDMPTSLAASLRRARGGFADHP
jgi:hypothetical protein